MWRFPQTSWLLLLVVSLVGCGESQPPQTSETNPSDSNSAAAMTSVTANGPAVAVKQFLEAVRTGNDDTAAGLLTTKAREETARMDLVVAPPGSDTASYEVGEVEFLNADAARVHSTWSDLDADAQRRSDPIVWVLRNEPEGWRIAGVAATVFAGEPPLLLNFENPQEMIQKQKWLAEETRRRAQEAAAMQAQVPESREGELRR